MNVYDTFDSAPPQPESSRNDLGVSFSIGWVGLTFCSEEVAVECWIGVVTEGERRIVRVAGRLDVAHVAGAAHGLRRKRRVGD